jgi:hypothetical protein
MNITILNVTVETKPTAKGSYQSADVAYKNNSFGGKVEGKKVMSFGATAEAFKVLATAQPGSTYEVNVVKNEKGYNDWVSMQPAGAGQGADKLVQVAGPGVSSGVSAGGAKARSPYETPEERAQRQVFIVRQSSIANAVAALSVGSKSPLAADAVIKLAKEFEGYVFATPKLGGETGFDDIPNLDPRFDTNPQIE